MSTSLNPNAIPNTVVAVVADVVGKHYNRHKTLDSIFEQAGAPGEPPEGNCVLKCKAWMMRTNTTPGTDPMKVLGLVIEEFMDVRADPARRIANEDDVRGRRKITDVLQREGHTYHKGGCISRTSDSPATTTLTDLIRAKDIPGVTREFQRTLSTVESDPPAAVTAACALLESLCKAYLEDNGVPLPAKQALGELYKTLRAHLKLDPSDVPAEDLKKIFSGLISMADGIASLRTHAGSAHGHGRHAYKIEARHARVAINSAHTLSVFIMETWHLSHARQNEPTTP
jgi:hypothetical protein